MDISRLTRPIARRWEWSFQLERSDDACLTGIPWQASLSLRPLAWAARGALVAALLALACDRLFFAWYDQVRYWRSYGQYAAKYVPPPPFANDPGRWSNIVFTEPPRFMPYDRDVVILSDEEAAAIPEGSVRLVRERR